MASTKTAVDFEWLTRFLLLGREGSCYMANSSKSVAINDTRAELNKCVKGLLADGMGLKMIDEIRRLDYTASGSAKAYLLAACSVDSDPTTKAEALCYIRFAFPISKDLFAFIQTREQLCKEANNGTGWGRSMRNAVGHWYKSRNPKDLCISDSSSTHNGWTHHDVLRLTHLTLRDCGDLDTTVVVFYLSHGLGRAEKEFGDMEAAADILTFLKELYRFRRIENEQEAVLLMKKHEIFNYESVPSSLKKSAEVMRRVIPYLRLNQLLILLKRFGKLGFLSSESAVLPVILEQLTSEKKIAASKLHPIIVYAALTKYEGPVRIRTAAGSAVKPTKPKHTPVPALVNALNTLMTATIKNYPPTGKRYLIAVDVRHQMVLGRVFGFHQMTAANAAALIILTLIEVEKDVTVVAFSANDLLVLDFKAGMSLVDISNRMRETPMSPIVDCAKPMRWAKQKQQPYDAFLILTDIETFVVDDVKPSDALRQYRQEMNLPKSRVVICGLCLRQRETVDDGPGVMYVAGLDHDAPHVIRGFVAGPGNVLGQ